jgi:hypothetical protein
MILPYKAFLEQGESWLLRMLMHRRVRTPSRGMLTRRLSLVGALGTLCILEDFLFSSALREELSTTGMWR